MGKKVFDDSQKENYFYWRLRNLAEEVEEEKKNLHELTKRYYDLLGILENAFLKTTSVVKSDHAGKGQLDS